LGGGFEGEWPALQWGRHSVLRRSERLLCHNVARTISHYVFESVNSTGLQRRQTLGFIQLMTNGDR
jgi:hypothetical protein